MKCTPKTVAIGCLLVIVIPILALLLFGWAAFRDRVTNGFHLASVEWLPATASDISFYRNANITQTLAYEFRITLADFERLAGERGWAVAPVSQSASIARYTLFLPPTHPERREPYYLLATDGLFFEHRQPNGAGITVLYDAQTSTAYIWQSAR